MIEININENVSVKLTDVGRAKLKNDHNDLKELSRGSMGDYVPKEEDKDGWSTWQLWQLMEQLGDCCRKGFRLPFEGTIRLEQRREQRIE